MTTRDDSDLPLRRALRDQLHREGLTAPGIDGLDLQRLQLREAGLRGCGIVDQGIDGRRFRVLEEAAYGSKRVIPRNESKCSSKL
jgi:hypothetical protein